MAGSQPGTSQERANQAPITGTLASQAVASTAQPQFNHGQFNQMMSGLYKQFNPVHHLMVLQRGVNNEAAHLIKRAADRARNMKWLGWSADSMVATRSQPEFMAHINATKVVNLNKSLQLDLSKGGTALLNMAAFHQPNAAFMALINKVSPDALSQALVKDAFYWSGTLALHAAARYQPEENFQALINKVSVKSLSAALVQVSAYNYTGLLYALEYKGSICGELIEKVTPEALNKTLLQQNTLGETSLHAASISLPLTDFESLCNKVSAEALNKSLVKTNKEGRTALHSLAIDRGGKKLKFILGKAGEKQLNQALLIKDKYGFTPLHYAAKHQAHDAFMVLVKKVTKESLDEVLAQPAVGWNVLHFSIRFQKNDLALTTIVNKASEKSIDSVLLAKIKDGWNGLSMAAHERSFEVIKTLLEKSSQKAIDEALVAKIDDGRTAFSEAIYHNSDAVMIELLRKANHTSINEALIIAKKTYGNNIIKTFADKFIDGLQNSRCNYDEKWELLKRIRLLLTSHGLTEYMHPLIKLLSSLNSNPPGNSYDLRVVTRQKPTGMSCKEKLAVIKSKFDSQYDVIQIEAINHNLTAIININDLMENVDHLKRNDNNLVVYKLNNEKKLSYCNRDPSRVLEHESDVFVIKKDALNHRKLNKLVREFIVAFDRAEKQANLLEFFRSFGQRQDIATPLSEIVTRAYNPEKNTTAGLQQAALPRGDKARRKEAATTIQTGVRGKAGRTLATAMTAEKAREKTATTDNKPNAFDHLKREAEACAWKKTCLHRDRLVRAKMANKISRKQRESASSPEPKSDSSTSSSPTSIESDFLSEKQKGKQKAPVERPGSSSDHENIPAKSACSFTPGQPLSSPLPIIDYSNLTV